MHFPLNNKNNQKIMDVCIIESIELQSCLPPVFSKTVRTWCVASLMFHHSVIWTPTWGQILKCTPSSISNAISVLHSPPLYIIKAAESCCSCIPNSCSAPFELRWGNTRFMICDFKSSLLAVRLTSAPKSLSLYHLMVDGSTCVYCHKRG